MILILLLTFLLLIVLKLKHAPSLDYALGIIKNNIRFNFLNALFYSLVCLIYFILFLHEVTLCLIAVFIFIYFVYISHIICAIWIFIQVFWAIRRLVLSIKLFIFLFLKWLGINIWFYNVLSFLLNCVSAHLDRGGDWWNFDTLLLIDMFF